MESFYKKTEIAKFNIINIIFIKIGINIYNLINLEFF